MKKCSEILATIKLLYNPRVNKVFTYVQFELFVSVVCSAALAFAL